MKCVLEVECEVIEFLPSEPGKPPVRLAPDWLVKQCIRRGNRLFAPPGTLYDDPDCYRLVLNGVATATDDECRAMDTRNPEQMAAAQKALRRLQLGIHPDDFKAYEAGEMVGYDPQGNPIPGPNAKPKTEDDDE